MMRRAGPLLLAVLAGASALVGRVARADPGVPTADLFRHLGVDDGLSQSTVAAITQDREGFLWFGTDDGLNRYDGTGFAVYRHVQGEPRSLASSRVLHVLEDRRGTLWVASQGGLQWFDRAAGTFHHPPGGAGAPGSACGTIVRALLEGPDGAVWSGALTGEVCRRPAGGGAFERVRRAAPAEHASVIALLLGPEGEVWVHGAPRACSVAPGGARCEPAAGAAQPLAALGGADLLGTATVGSASASRLMRRRDGVWRPWVELPAARVSTGPQAVAAVRGRIWVATESHGVAVLDPETGARTSLLPQRTVESGFRDPTVHAIYPDSDGGVWVGTSDGVSYWDGLGGRFELYRARPGGLSSNRVNGMHVARDGAVWVGTNDGLNRLDPETGAIRVFRRPAAGGSAHPNAFWRVFEDAPGRILVGGRREGLFELRGGRFVRDPALDATLGRLVRSPSSAAIRFVGEDSRGRLWLGTADGAAVHDPATGRGAIYRGRTDRLPAHRVNVVHEDAAGAIWVGTDAGVCRLDEAADRFACVGADRGLDSEVTWTLAESAATPGVLWVGTIGGGLCALDTAAMAAQCLALGSGLPSDVVYGVLPADDGALWLTTTAGLVAFDPRTADARLYTEADGLQSNEFDLMAFARGPDGSMLVGGRRGFNRFHPARIARSERPPPIRLTRTRVLGAPRPGLPASGDTLRLRHDEPVFAIDFAALDYTDPHRTRYRYRLRGYDEAWRETDGRRPTASYTRVPPGRYRFEVVGASRDGGFSREPAALTVVVRPAWWQRGGVRALAALALAGALALLVRARVRRAAREQTERIRMQRRLAESRERERYRIARELHDGPVQGLYRLGHELDRASLRGAADAAAAPSVRAAREQVNDVADELRDVLRALRPPVIEHLGVGPAVSSMGREVARAHPQIRVRDGVETDGRTWPVEVQHAVYRIAQEALSNAVRHGAPSRIDLALRHEPDGARLVVQDDGAGFAVPGALADLARRDHFGLIGLVERAEALGGRVRVRSQPGAGTRVSALLPVEVAERPADAVRPAAPAGPRLRYPPAP